MQAGALGLRLQPPAPGTAALQGPSRTAPEAGGIPGQGANPRSEVSKGISARGEEGEGRREGRTMGFRALSPTLPAHPSNSCVRPPGGSHLAAIPIFIHQGAPAQIQQGSNTALPRVLMEQPGRASCPPSAGSGAWGPRKSKSIVPTTKSEWLIVPWDPSGERSVPCPPASPLDGALQGVGVQAFRPGGV